MYFVRQYINYYSSSPHHVVFSRYVVNKIVPQQCSVKTSISTGILLLLENHSNNNKSYLILKNSIFIKASTFYVFSQQFIPTTFSQFCFYIETERMLILIFYHHLLIKGNSTNNKNGLYTENLYGLLFRPVLS